MAKKTILVVDADPASRNFLARTLQGEGYEVLLASLGKEALIGVWRDRPDLIVVDPQLPDLPGEELIAKLRQDARSAAVRAIALSSDASPERTSACLSAGFDEYVVKSAQAVSALPPLILRLLEIEPAAAARDGGLMIVFLSAKGGTGTSSLCANIAMNIAQHQPEARVVVLDLVLPIGSIAPIVGYEEDLNLVTITELPPETVSSEFLQHNLPTPEPWLFQLVAGSPDPESANNRLKVERIPGIVSALKSQYNFVAVDLGRSLSRISLPIIQQADLVCLIVSTDLPTVELSRTVWEYLQVHGVEANGVYTILNRAVGLEGLTKPEAEEIIGLRINTAIPYLGSNFALANNQHQPYALKFPQDTAALILKQTASEMAALAQRLRAR